MEVNNVVKMLQVGPS